MSMSHKHLPEYKGITHIMEGGRFCNYSFARFCSGQAMQQEANGSKSDFDILSPAQTGLIIAGYHLQHDTQVHL